MSYLLILTLAAPRGDSTKVGVTSVTATAIRYHLLNDSGERTNPNATNEADRTTHGLPSEAEVLADIEASLPA